MNECDYIRKMLIKNYLGKAHSKAAKAEKWNDLKIRNCERNIDAYFEQNGTMFGVYCKMYSSEISRKCKTFAWIWFGT